MRVDERSSLISHTKTPGAETVVISDDESNHVDRAVTLSTGHGFTLAMTLFVSIFLLTANTSVIITIQSSVAADLDATSEVIWFNSSYLIAITSVIAVAGKLCTIFSPRAYFLTSTLIQAVGLALTASASNLSTFLAGRVVCGIGTAAAVPVTYILVINIASKSRQGLLFGCISCGYTTGVALGALIGGVLQPAFGWRSVFWVQIPTVLCVAFVAYCTIPPILPTALQVEQGDDDGILTKLRKTDWLGASSLITSVVLLLFGLASAPISFPALILSLVFASLFCCVEYYWTQHPILPPALLTSRGNMFTGLATIGLMSCRWGVLFYTPTFAIAVRGWTPSEAGLLLVVTNFGFGLGGVTVGLTHIKRAGSFYVPCLVFFSLFAAEQYVFSRLATERSSVWSIALALWLNGFIAGSILNYSLAHLLHVTEPSHHAIAVTLNAMFRSLSGSIGSSAMGGIFLRSLQRSLRDGFERRNILGKEWLIRQLLGRPMLVQGLTGDEHKVAVEAYAVSIQRLLSIGSLLVVAMILVQAGTGWSTPSKRCCLS